MPKFEETWFSYAPPALRLVRQFLDLTRLSLKQKVIFIEMRGIEPPNETGGDEVRSGSERDA